jgi:hypothetical protein
VIGYFIPVDQDVADKAFTVELTAGVGDSDNQYFSIVNGALYPKVTFSIDDVSTKNIRVKLSDPSGATFEKRLSIEIVDAASSNRAPRGFGLSNAIIFQEYSVNDEIATIFMSDPDGGEGTFTCDNEFVRIEGNKLILKEMPESNKIFSVKITATDGAFDISQNINLYAGDIANSTGYLKTTTNIKIWPNPAKTVINIEKPGKVRIFDMSGKILINEKVERVLNVASLRKGVYLLHLDTGFEYLRKKIVIE